MNKAFLEFLVLGQIPGTDIIIGYSLFLVIAGVLMMLISTYATFRYRFYVARKLRLYTPAKLVDLKTL